MKSKIIIGIICTIIVLIIIFFSTYSNKNVRSDIVFPDTFTPSLGNLTELNFTLSFENSSFTMNEEISAHFVLTNQKNYSVNITEPNIYALYSPYKMVILHDNLTIITGEGFQTVALPLITLNPGESYFWNQTIKYPIDGSIPDWKYTNESGNVTDFQFLPGEYWLLGEYTDYTTGKWITSNAASFVIIN